MIRIEASRIFPVPVGDAFAYITDLKHWPEYWPDFVRVEDAANARWGNAGDTVTIVLRLLRRERALNMKLEAFRRNECVSYASRQQGLPDVQHERHFRSVPGGCEYRLVVAFEPRRGWTGLIDRLLLRRAIAQAMRRTLASLEGILFDRALHADLLR